MIDRPDCIRYKARASRAAVARPPRERRPPLHGSPTAPLTGALALRRTAGAGPEAAGGVAGLRRACSTGGVERWGGLVEGDGLGVLGEGRGARTSFFAVVTGLLLALHGFAFPSIRALVLS